MTRRLGGSGVATRVLGALAGLGSVAVGVLLVRRTETAFGATWALLFVVLGVILLLSVVTLTSAPAPPATSAREVTWEGEPARFHPRRTHRSTQVGLVVLTLLGGWFAVMGVVGAVTENWFWPVLAALPAVYFLGIPVLAALGRFRAGGTWITPTRLIDEQSGLRSELRLTDIATVTPRSESVHVAPLAGAAVTRRALAPRPWRARPRSGDLVISVDGPPGSSEELAVVVRTATEQRRR